MAFSLGVVGLSGLFALEGSGAFFGVTMIIYESLRTTAMVLVIILVCIIFIFLGDFLEVVSINIITLPIIFPILLAIGIDPVWFAVIMTINMEFALITPPGGLNLFVIKGVVEDASLMEVFQGTLPFMLLMLAVLALVILFPLFSLWLPFMVC